VTETVATGLLPVNLAERKLKGNGVRRVALLAETLAKHWKGDSPFRFQIVCGNADTAAIRDALPRAQNLKISFRTEEDCLGASARYLDRFDWWRRRNIMNMAAVGAADAEAVLLFSLDVVCVADFDATSFVLDGKLVSAWEPKSIHPWWEATEKLLGVNIQTGEYGISAPPAGLAPPLMKEAWNWIDSQFGEQLTFLGVSRRLASGYQAEWTDMTLYTTISEARGTLWDAHADPATAFVAKRQLRSSHSVWADGDFDAKAAQFDPSKPDATFVYIGADLDIDVKEIRAAYSGTGQRRVAQTAAFPGKLPGR
jgi:hypothetical protein